MAWGNNGGWQGGGRGPWGSGPNIPPERPANDLDDMFRKGSESFRSFFSGGNGRTIAILILVALVLWLATGIYRVKTNEQGVVLRFGKYHRTSDPGLNYHLPWPFEEVITPAVTSINKIEIGYRSPLGRRTAEQRVNEESLMLTGDENIVDITFDVHWKIRNARNFLFNIRNQDETIKTVAESAMREVIGRSKSKDRAEGIASVLSEDRKEIEDETRQLLQEVLNYYGAGVEIIALQIQKGQYPEPVIKAARDVQTAKADKERMINEAEAYENSIIPKAKGQAERVIQEAEGYKEGVIAEAQGEAERFISIYQEYKLAKDVTKKRLYLETMEEILQGMEKLIVDQEHGSGVVPYLPLPELRKRQQQEAGQ